MLARTPRALCLGFVVVAVLFGVSPTFAEADDPTATMGADADGTLSAGVADEVPGTGPTSYYLPSGERVCVRSSGAPVPCTDKNNFDWNDEFQTYCIRAFLSADDSHWDTHRDRDGNPTGSLYECVYIGHEFIDHLEIRWSAEVYVPAVEPVVRKAVDSLGLHQPVVGAGAYVYEGKEEYGPSWWVGSPMWLWADAGDDLQWGTHTLSASVPGISITATVTATKLSVDPGNGDGPAVCHNRGTPRPWKPDDLLAHHSPSGCEYTYLTTSDRGDPDSHYLVTATVTWTIVWSASDGEAGQFTQDMTSAEPKPVHIGRIRGVLVNPDDYPT